MNPRIYEMKSKHSQYIGQITTAVVGGRHFILAIVNTTGEQIKVTENVELLTSLPREIMEKVVEDLAQNIKEKNDGEKGATFN